MKGVFRSKLGEQVTRSMVIAGRERFPKLERASDVDVKHAESTISRQLKEYIKLDESFSQRIKEKMGLGYDYDFVSFRIKIIPVYVPIKGGKGGQAYRMFISCSIGAIQESETIERSNIVWKVERIRNATTTLHPSLLLPLNNGDYSPDLIASIKSMLEVSNDI